MYAHYRIDYWKSNKCQVDSAYKSKMVNLLKLCMMFIYHAILEKKKPNDNSIVKIKNPINVPYL